MEDGTELVVVEFGEHCVKFARLAGRKPSIVEYERVAVLTPAEESYGEALRGLSQNHTLPKRGAVFVVPAQMCFSRELAFPFRDRRRIEATFKFELEGQVPVEIEEVVADYILISSDEEGSRIIAFALKKEVIRAILSSASSVGISPARIDIDIIGLCRLARSLGRASGTILIADIGAVATKLALVSDGELIAQRSFRAGGDSITSAVASAEGIDYQEAEERKLGGELEPDLIRQPLTRIVKEIRRFLLTTGEEPREVLLCGGVSATEGVDELLSDLLKLPVSKLDYGEKASVAGGALGGEPALDFLREEFSPGSTFARIKVSLFCALVACTSLFGAVDFAIFKQCLLLTNRLTEIDRQRQEFWRTALPGEPYRREGFLRYLASRRQELETDREGIYQPETFSAFELLRRIASAIPPSSDVSFHRIDISQKSTRLSGRGSSVASAERIASSITRLTSLKASITRFAKKDGQVEFSLEVEVGK